LKDQDSRRPSEEDPLLLIFKNSGQSSPTDLSSTDWNTIYQDLLGIWHEKLQAIDDRETAKTFYGLGGEKATRLYFDSVRVEGHYDTVFGVRKNIADLSKEEIACTQHLRNIRHLLEQAAHTIANQNGRQDRRESLVESISVLKNLGYTADDIKEKFLPILRVWFTFTPHPTKDLNYENGICLYQDLISSTEKLNEERKESVGSTIDKMIRNPLTPSRKDTMLDETAMAAEREKVYCQGMLTFLEDLQYAMDDTFGPGAIDVLDPDIICDIAARTWYSGDADGKENADAASLLVKFVSSMHTATEIHIEELANAAPSDGAIVRPILDRFSELNVKLKTLHAKKEELIVAGTHNSGESIHTLFEDVLKESSELYNEDFVEEIKVSLSEALKKDGIHQDTKRALWRSLALISQCGIASAKHEIRHSAANHETIYGNLFHYLQTNGIVSINGGGDLRLLSPEEFIDALNSIKTKAAEIKPGNPNAAIKEWFFAANPHDKGFVHQILRRFEVMSAHQDKLGIAIIAGAKLPSQVGQQFLAESFDIEGLVHVPLNEEEETTLEADTGMKFYDTTFGGENIAKRIASAKPGTQHQQGYYVFMEPQSDIQKLFGPLAKGMQVQTLKNMIDWSLEKGRAIFRKVGSGLALGRGGGSPFTQPRLLLFTVKDKILSKDKILNEKQKYILQQMGCFLSTTIQGRDGRIRMGTPVQAANMIADAVTEMAGVFAAIDGKIDSKLIIQDPVEYSDSMQSSLEDAQEYLRTKFHTLRTKESTWLTGVKQLDLWAMKVSSMLMSKFTNVGARKAARTDQGQQENMQSDIPVATELRAIGSNIAADLSGVPFDCFFLSGDFCTKYMKIISTVKLLKQIS